MLAAGLLFLLASQSNLGVKYLNRINSQREFDSLARIADYPYRLPHLRFTIDRRDGKIYYFDSKVDRHHRELANATYLSLDRADTFFKQNYLSPNRRFILGWIGYHTPLGKWAFEFWEGDTIDKRQIAEAAEIVKKTLFKSASFKPNSLRQEEQSANIEGLPRLLPKEVRSGRVFDPLNLGRRVGTLKIAGKGQVLPGDIVILTATPASLSPVAGMIFAQPTTPLSHLGMLARQWCIPSATINDADRKFVDLIGKTVVYEVEKGGFVLRLATESERAASKPIRRVILKLPVLDLKTRELSELSSPKTRSTSTYGAKAANLAIVAQSKLSGVRVPPGFVLPVALYHDFCQAHGIAELVDKAIGASPNERPQALETLRRAIENGSVNPSVRTRILEKSRAMFGKGGVFVRSSTNAEDIPGFNGAGLYTTVPNVIGDESLIQATKTVWASVWNENAFETREQAGIDHRGVAMAVLIQIGVNADSAGVMVTANPFDPSDLGAVYISAKRGLGIRVVDGKRVPEQLIWRPNAGSVQVLTRSEDDSLLTFDENGGVKESRIAGGRTVLTDQMVRKLVDAGRKIQRLFKGVPQDIEWVVIGQKLLIVQSRPYLSS